MKLTFVIQLPNQRFASLLMRGSGLLDSNCGEDTRLLRSEVLRLQLWSVLHYRLRIIDNRRLTACQVAGESGLGKTTFINTLFSTTIKNYADHKRRHAKQVDKTVEIEITKAELEEKFFKGTYSGFIVPVVRLRN